MAANSSFKEQVYSLSFEELFMKLSELLGCNEDTIVSFIGKPDNTSTYPDDTSTYEYETKFIFYEKFKALFMIPSDSHIAEYVSCPKANVEGSPLETTDSFYNFQGIKLGDTRDAIQKNWGSPTRQATYAWIYGSKFGITKSKNQYEIVLEFDSSSSGDANILIGFKGRLKKIENEGQNSTTEKPKEGCFIATTCYGDYDAYEVLKLRQYRDNFLLKYYIGKVAVNIYYLLSPPLSRLIVKSDKLKDFIRKYLLNPIISKIQHRQNH